VSVPPPMGSPTRPSTATTRTPCSPPRGRQWRPLAPATGRRCSSASRTAGTATWRAVPYRSPRDRRGGRCPIITAGPARRRGLGAADAPTGSTGPRAAGRRRLRPGQADPEPGPGHHHRRLRRAGVLYRGRARSGRAGDRLGGAEALAEARRDPAVYLLGEDAPPAAASRSLRPVTGSARAHHRRRSASTIVSTAVGAATAGGGRSPRSCSGLPDTCMDRSSTTPPSCAHVRRAVPGAAGAHPGGAGLGMAAQL
jgi:hypothetical protein